MACQFRRSRRGRLPRPGGSTPPKTATVTGVSQPRLASARSSRARDRCQASRVCRCAAPCRTPQPARRQAHPGGAWGTGGRRGASAPSSGAPRTIRPCPATDSRTDRAGRAVTGVPASRMATAIASATCSVEPFLVAKPPAHPPRISRSPGTGGWPRAPGPNPAGTLLQAGRGQQARPEQTSGPDTILRPCPLTACCRRPAWTGHTVPIWH